MNGSQDEYDIGRIVQHAISYAAREHMVRVTSAATTALLGRKNYEGLGGFWPTVVENEEADPRDRTFATWAERGREGRLLLQADELDRLSITLCPELVGGCVRLFEDGVPASSWILTDLSTTESGAICLLYVRQRPGPSLTQRGGVAESGHPRRLLDDLRGRPQDRSRDGSCCRRVGGEVRQQLASRGVPPAVVGRPSLA